MAKAVFGLVDTESQAERIVDNLKVAGFRNNDISVLFPDKGGTRDFAHERLPRRLKAPRQVPARVQWSVVYWDGLWASVH